MSNITAHIANATGSMNEILNSINGSFTRAVQKVSEELQIEDVDVIFINAPNSAIPELGVSGFSPSANLVYVYLDPSVEPAEDDIYATLIHELHHAKRWRDPGYGSTLWDSLVTEGLACLYEEEVTGVQPIYAKSEDKPISLLAVLDLLDDKYNHQQVFITGNDVLPRWFGYYAGYEIAKEVLRRDNLSAAEAVDKKIKYDQKVVGALD
jgi:uncharacterized protein YjaZ